MKLFFALFPRLQAPNPSYCLPVKRKRPEQLRFRDECLNREQLWTLTEGRVVVGDYRQSYNQVRPHSRLGYEIPAVFAARSCPSPAPFELRPHSAGDEQRTNKNTNSTMSQH